MWSVVVSLMAGIVFFLFGFRFIEEAIKAVTGRSFKLYLKRQTAHPLKAVIGGAVVTALLQSSSIVNFIVLSFVGAGVLKLQHALAIMLGSNLGTTLSSWVIALIGFRFDLDTLALPLISLFGMITLLFTGNTKYLQWSKFLVGLGFLFFGLEYIKNSVSETLLNYDISSLSQYPLIVFVGFGLIATSLTQSSSVTVALTLIALNGQVISLIAAMAIVLGSEVGTTLKLVLASFGGPAAKKKVAFGNMIFNAVTLVLALLLIYPTYHLIKNGIGVEDNLIALVLYQTLINVAGIILFLPFLNRFGNWLDQHIFLQKEETIILHKIKVTEGEYALHALDQETLQFMYSVCYFARKSFDLNPMVFPTWEAPVQFRSMSREQIYTHLKLLHGDIRNYGLKLQRITFDPDGLQRITQLQETIRDAMYVVKTIKDSFQDIDLLRNSSNDVKYGFYIKTRTDLDQLIQRLTTLFLPEHKGKIFDKLLDTVRQLESSYKDSINHFYRDGIELTLSPDEFSTLINFNREAFNAGKYLVIMVKEYNLDPARHEEFNELLHPGY